MLLRVIEFCKTSFKGFSSLNNCLYCEGYFQSIDFNCTTVSNKGFDEMCNDDLSYY